MPDEVSFYNEVLKKGRTLLQFTRTDSSDVKLQGLSTSSPFLFNTCLAEWGYTSDILRSRDYTEALEALGLIRVANAEYNS